MSYNNKYNTRNSGRFNTPGQFIPSSELVPGAARSTAGVAPAPAPPIAPLRAPRIKQPGQQQQSLHMQPPPLPPPLPQRTPQQRLQNLQTIDTEMKSEPDMDVSTASDDSSGRPHWMKSKLPGVKKISNKERRRRQNENLRRLLTPKNALMVLNEMMPNEQVANQFKVESAANNQYYKPQNMHSFCADLTLEGTNYKGYGENKLMARNAAAEQAIRDLIIKRMHKVASTENKEGGGGGGGGDVGGDVGMEGGEGGAEGAEESALPMIQLASFALHKLFTEWEYDGHKVPQLKPNNNSVSEGGESCGAPGAAAGAPSAAPGAPRKPKPKVLPLNAPAMHPCMLLTYMRPVLEYQEIAVDGDRPQNMMFTMAVEVDGTTYVGKASNKKEARKAAARAACSELFNVVFDPVPTANAPKVPPN